MSRTSLVATHPESDLGVLWKTSIGFISGCGRSATPPPALGERGGHEKERGYVAHAILPGSRDMFQRMARSHMPSPARVFGRCWEFLCLWCVARSLRPGPSRADRGERGYSDLSPLAKEDGEASCAGRASRLRVCCVMVGGEKGRARGSFYTALPRFLWRLTDLCSHISP